MFRKIICTLSVLVPLVLAVPAQASARTGSIRICPDWGGDLVGGGAVTLYRVGEPVTGGYRLTDGLADWTVWESDALSEEVKNWVLNQNLSGGRREEIPLTGALFSSLAEGLYLAVQEETAPGFMPFSPFLLRLPEEGFWDLTVNPQIGQITEPPKTADHPAPIIGAMGLGLSAAVLMVLIDRKNQ